MRKIWPSSILSRTAAILLASAGLTGTVFILLASSAISERFHQETHDRLGELIDTVERTVSIACYLSDESLAAEVIQGLMKNWEVGSIVIFDEKNNKLASMSRPDGPSDTGTNQLVDVGAHGLAEIRRPIMSPFDSATMVGEIVLTPNYPAIHRLIAKNVHNVEWLLIIEIALFFVVAILLLLLLVIRPIEQVSASLHDMDARAGEKLIPPYGHADNEIGRLVDDINTLAGQLIAVLREERTVRLQREAGQRKYQAIFDNAKAGICIVASNGRVLSHNPAFTRITGLGAATGQKALFLTGLYGSNPDVIANALGECLSLGTTVTEEIELLNPMSGSLWLHLSLTPLGKRFAQGIINDITELTLAKQAAENASQAKSTFLASMSHELRTPLNAIIGFSQLLEMGGLMPLAEEQKEAVGHILASSRHLLSLIDEILDLARIESGKLDISLENVLLPALIDEAVTLLLPTAAARRISIQQSCVGRIAVFADRSRVRQILLNLLSNAVKYNRDGGYVALSCAELGGTIRITVTDTGVGIDNRYRDELFQPFQRLGAERTSIEGTGIGLVVCKRLVEAMAGSIGFDSTPGVGSRFWIDLPSAAINADMLEALPAQIKPSAPEENKAFSGRVVYVEDSLVNINVMKHIFRRISGVELLVAENGEAGLELIRAACPDFVLMDINLPGMSGLEVLKLLKADPATASIPVFAVSAAALPQDVDAGMEAGFTAYLTKPIDVFELIGLVQKTLGRNIETDLKRFS